MRLGFAGALLLTLTSYPVSFLTSSDPTPGSTALLINQDVAQAKPSLEQAFHDPQPAVRMIAARVTAMAPIPDLSTQLLAAFAHESDPAVLVEDIHDVLLLSGPSAEPAIEAQLQHGGRSAVLAYAEGLGRIQPEQLASKIAGLFALANDAGTDFTRLVRMSGALHPDRREELYRAWMNVAPQSAWRSLLYQTFSSPEAASGAADLLVSALNSDRGDIRTETVWFIVGRRGMPDAVLNAALPRAENAPLDWEAFGRELIARSYKHLSTPDRAEFLRSALRMPEPGGLDLRTNSTLTEAERAVLKEVPSAGPIEIDPWSPASAVTASPIAPGSIKSLLDASGCEAHAGIPGTATIAYVNDGRPKQIQVSPQGLSPACQTALTTIARLTLELPEHAATQGPQMLVLPFDKDTIECVDDTRGPHAHAVRPARVDRRRVPVPEKIKDARPFYPPEAQKQGIEGPEIVEAVIGSRGCVQHARVLRSLSPSLDAAALAAATRTLFKPPLVEGKPAPVVMTMTITFGLVERR